MSRESGPSRRFERPAGIERAAAVFVAAFGLVLLFVWHQAAVDRLVLRLDAEKERGSRLESDVHALRYEVESLASHGQVTGEAVERLSMIRPGQDQIVKLRFEGDASDAPRWPGLVSEATAGPETGGAP